MSRESCKESYKERLERQYRRRWYMFPPFWFLAGVIFTLITIMVFDFCLYMWLL